MTNVINEGKKSWKPNINDKLNEANRYILVLRLI